MEETISLQDLFKIIRKRLVHIISLTIIGALIAGVISFFLITPMYQASTQILVNKQAQEQQTIQSQDIQTNLQLINTYNVIIKSPAILSLVIEHLDLNLTPAQLSEKISVASQNDSQVVNVTVQDENPAIAVEIANTTAEVFKNEIPDLMSIKNGVHILSPAILSENPSPVKPNKMLNIAIGAVLGLMIGLGLAFLLEYLDTTIKTEEDVEEILDLPIIGLVSPIPDEQPISNPSRRGRGK
ncbi:capsular biosynthesis protein [Lysinibacillus yapensis]|uniref:Capsular biosynthesis protein n=1 Tax=Ureibacillus yapensis TaxID=2304605 RepID=A0A396SEN3_9BACL|nr:Wzz/FepE/Etk N-terminal domain-containing protein [Lysinibacillus yapensis]RHW39572.1 capsular biosynthesis protein [Lysinibacillus yapensis]